MNNKEKIIIFILILLMVLYAVELFHKQDTTNLINKTNIEVIYKDTIIKDNPNINIIVIDSIEYLIFKYGKQIQIIKHK